MEDLVLELERKTAYIISQINFVSQDELEQFIEQREEIVQKISLRLTAGSEPSLYRERVIKLLQNDELIRKRISEIQHKNQLDIVKVNQAKKQKMIYETEYAVDGYMFDKRK